MMQQEMLRKKQMMEARRAHTMVEEKKVARSEMRTPHADFIRTESAPIQKSETPADMLGMEEFECLVCCELPIIPMETSCCGTILCEECSVKLKGKQCPNRCEGDTFSTQRNRFVERMLRNVKTKCAFCDHEAT